jgi:hypothetical protein
MIGSRYVLTSGSCIYNHESGGWFDDYSYTSDAVGPIKTTNWADVVVMNRWIDHKDPNYNFGLIALEEVVWNAKANFPVENAELYAGLDAVGVNWYISGGRPWSDNRYECKIPSVKNLREGIWKAEGPEIGAAPIAVESDDGRNVIGICNAISPNNGKSEILPINQNIKNIINELIGLFEQEKINEAPEESTHNTKEK